MIKLAKTEIDTIIQLLTKEAKTLNRKIVNSTNRQNALKYEKERNKLLNIVEHLENY